MEPELFQHTPPECKLIRFTPTAPPQQLEEPLHPDSTFKSLGLGRFGPVCDRQVTSSLFITVAFQ